MHSSPSGSTTVFPSADIMRGSEGEAFNLMLGMPDYPVRKTPAKSVILWMLWVRIPGSGATRVLCSSNTELCSCLYQGPLRFLAQAGSKHRALLSNKASVSLRMEEALLAGWYLPIVSVLGQEG